MPPKKKASTKASKAPRAPKDDSDDDFLTSPPKKLKKVNKNKENKVDKNANLSKTPPSKLLLPPPPVRIFFSCLLVFLPNVGIKLIYAFIAYEDLGYSIYAYNMAIIFFKYFFREIINFSKFSLKP